MSLRAFHVFFIVISALLAVFVAAWAGGQYQTQHEAGFALAAAGSLAAAGALTAYAVRFTRKTRGM